MRYPNLKAELARRGLTQGQLAKHLGKTEAVISNKIKGKYGYAPFSLDERLEICVFLGMDPTPEIMNYLFKGESV